MKTKLKIFFLCLVYLVPMLVGVVLVFSDRYAEAAALYASLVCTAVVPKAFRRSLKKIVAADDKYKAYKDLIARNEAKIRQLDELSKQR